MVNANNALPLSAIVVGANVTTSGFPGKIERIYSPLTQCDGYVSGIVEVRLKSGLVAVCASDLKGGF